MSADSDDRDRLTAIAPAALAGRRIVMVLGSLGLGGAERQAVGLGRYLGSQARAEVSVVGFAEPQGPAARMFQDAEIPVHLFPVAGVPGGSYGWPGLAYWIVRFAKFVRQLKPDLLLPFCAVPNVLGALAWRWTGAKTCIWNQRDAGISPAFRLEGWAARQVPCIVANSTAGIQYLVKTHGVALQKIHLIPNAVALEPPQADRLTWRRRLGLEERQFAACMLGNLHANKDHQTLLHAWREVLVREGRNGRPPVLLLAGRWDDQANALCALAHELDLFQDVRFVGAVRDVSGLLAASDLAVFSSRREGCPNGVLEAMAAGLPVVATDIPGTRDALGSGAGERLVPAGDSAAMAKQILRFFSDFGLRAREGKKNALRVESEFAPDRSWRAMADVIGSTLQRS